MFCATSDQFTATSQRSVSAGAPTDRRLLFGALMASAFIPSVIAIAVGTAALNTSTPQPSAALGGPTDHPTVVDPHSTDVRGDINIAPPTSTQAPDKPRHRMVPQRRIAPYRAAGTNISGQPSHQPVAQSTAVPPASTSAGPSNVPDAEPTRSSSPPSDSSSQPPTPNILTFPDSTPEDGDEGPLSPSPSTPSSSSPSAPSSPSASASAPSFPKTGGYPTPYVMPTVLLTARPVTLP